MYNFSSLFMPLGIKKIIKVLPFQLLHLSTYFSSRPGIVTP